jgi:hypothetical protein
MPKALSDDSAIVNSFGLNEPGRRIVPSITIRHAIDIGIRGFAVDSRGETFYHTFQEGGETKYRRAAVPD